MDEVLDVGFSVIFCLLIYSIEKEELKMRLSKFIANSIAKLALVAAKEASGTASWYGSGQPKEPKNLKEMLKKK